MNFEIVGSILMEHWTIHVFDLIFCFVLFCFVNFFIFLFFIYLFIYLFIFFFGWFFLNMLDVIDNLHTENTKIPPVSEEI